jgi:hypothetical protein
MQIVPEEMCEMENMKALAETFAALPAIDGTITMHFVLFRTASGTAF